MKFVALINLKKPKGKGRVTTFIHREPGPLPPIVIPDEDEDEDKPKDGEPPKVN